jgi:hypothetical protein
LRNLAPKPTSFREKYPKFAIPRVYEPLSEDSKVWKMDIRPNTLLVRPYSPAGFTENGLWVTLNEKWARVWAFVLATSYSSSLRYQPGDLIVFERWSELLLDYDESVNPSFAGEKQPICILHEKAVIARIENNRLPVPM